MKIYTKKGDRGETGLFGNQRVSKQDLRIEAYGTVDELNSVLGLVIVQDVEGWVTPALVEIQQDLFELGSYLATPDESTRMQYGIHPVGKKQAERLEKKIDEWDALLPALTSFILPGGTTVGALLHFARTVCRRAERRLVSLHEKEKVDPEVILYINRLSDYLFVFARYVNYKAGKPETLWERKK